MTREPLKLSWRRPAPMNKALPAIDIPLPVNSSGISRLAICPQRTRRKKRTRTRPRSPPPKPQIKLVGHFPHSSHNRLGSAENAENAEIVESGLGFGLGLDEIIMSKLQLSSSMTAKAVSRAWNSTLHRHVSENKVPNLLVHTSTGGFAAMDLNSSTWAQLPSGCPWPVPNCPSSAMVDSASGLVCITPVIPEARGTALVGNPLTNQWTDFVGYHDPFPFILFPDEESHTFTVLHGGMYARLYRSTTASWEELPSLIPRRRSFIYMRNWYYTCNRGNKMVYMLGERDPKREVLLIVYSFVDRSFQWVEMKWPERRIFPYGRLLVCGERLYFVGLGGVQVDELNPKPPAKLCIWQRAGSLWDLVAEYGAEVSRDDHGYCSDGVDRIWFMVTLFDGSRCTLAFTCQDKEWNVLPRCPFPTIGNPEFMTLGWCQWKLCPDCELDEPSRKRSRLD